jgi:hypothetical protein
MFVLNMYVTRYFVYKRTEVCCIAYKTLLQLTYDVCFVLNVCYVVCIIVYAISCVRNEAL